MLSFITTFGDFKSKPSSRGNVWKHANLLGFGFNWFYMGYLYCFLYLSTGKLCDWDGWLVGDNVVIVFTWCYARSGCRGRLSCMLRVLLFFRLLCHFLFSFQLWMWGAVVWCSILSVRFYTHCWAGRSVYSFLETILAMIFVVLFLSWGCQE